MDRRNVNGEEWGIVWMGRNKNVPSYRKLVDGKWVATKTQFVPNAVAEAFKYAQSTEEATTDNVVAVETIKDEFGFSGIDEDTTEIPQESELDTCSLKDLCDALYRRFGIYTCYLMREPNVKDIHPITGNLMNNFTLGQTRNQYFQARRSGANYNPEVMKNVLGARDQSSFDFEAHYAEHPDRFEAPVTQEQSQMSMAEYREMRKQQSTPIMGTERGRFDDGSDPDELYAEPPINGRTIIRPYKSSPSAERRLQQAREMRGYNV